MCYKHPLLYIPVCLSFDRETPTAAGPNSFGKGKLGFCERSKLLEKEMFKKMNEISGDNERR